MTPVDAAGGHCYQISTAMQVCSPASVGGVRLSNTWSIYREVANTLGKLRLKRHRLRHLEGVVVERYPNCRATASR